MATDQQSSTATADGGVTTGSETLTVTDNRTGKTYELPIEDNTIRGLDLRQIKVDESEFGMLSYDPAFTNTASCRSAITFIDGDAGILDLPRGRLPAGLRRAADQAPARALGLRHHPPHLRPRGPQEPLRGLPLRRAPDGDAALRRRRPLDLLPRREADRGPGRALHGRGAADREDPDAGRVLLPAQHGLPLRLPGQRPELLRELPLDDVQKNGSAAPAERSSLEGARCALHPARGPRTELLDERGPRRRLLRRRSLLGGRRRHRRPLRAVARRGERGRPANAEADRVARQHPRLSRAGEGARGETDGLRPPRLQELRPAGADHPAAHGRGVRGDRVQPTGRDRPRAGETGARRRLLHLAQALPERRLLLGDHLRGAGDPDQHVHRDLRHPAYRGMGLAVDGDERRPRAENRPPAPGLHRGARADLRLRRGSRGAGKNHRAPGAAAQTAAKRRVGQRGGSNSPPLSTFSVESRWPKVEGSPKKY